MPTTTASNLSYSATVNTQVTAQENPIKDNDIIRTKILLLGLRRSGKTSIVQVLFNDLDPKQSFFVETTTRVTTHNFDSIIPLEIWDCPGSIGIEAIGAPLASFASIIFVVDIQDSYHQPIAKLIDIALAAFQENPEVNLEVFVHKAEALSEDFRFENFRHIQSRILDELADMPPLTMGPSASQSNLPSPSSESSETREFVPEQIPLTFHLTSVYDYTLHEAFSRVLQRLLVNTCLPFLEDLLNVFCANSHSPKAFLFDTYSRVFVATNSSPVDTITHNLCCDYVSMLNNFGGLYKSAVASPTRHLRRTGDTPDTASVRRSQLPSTSSAPATPNLSVHTSPSQSVTTSFSPPSPPHSHPSPPRPSNGSPRIASANHSTRQSSLESSTPSHTSVPPQPSKSAGTKSVFYPSSATSLTPFTTLIYHTITPRLALLALLPTTVWESRKGLVEYNVVFFREGVQEICVVEHDARRRRPAPPAAPASAARKK